LAALSTALSNILSVNHTQEEECTNLLVPVCLSASHVAYGSICMEPVFIILGQSAGVAAALAIDEGIAVQDLLYEETERETA